MNTENFYLEGSIRLNDPECCQPLIDVLPYVQWEPYFHGGMEGVGPAGIVNKALSETFERIRQRHLSQLFAVCDVTKTFFHRGYTTDSTNWHNDAIEGHNTTVAVHLCTMTPSSGGHFEVRRKDDGKVTTYIQQRGDILIWTHAPGYVHRVIPIHNNTDRIAALYDCNAY